MSTWNRLVASVCVGLERWRDMRLFDPTASHPARVICQSLNRERVDVVADDPRIGAVYGAPLAVGVPLLAISLQPGERVFLTWRSRSSKEPVVLLPPDSENVQMLADSKIKVIGLEQFADRAAVLS